VPLEYVNAIPRTQSGVIAQDAVWTSGSTGEPYVIASDLTVPAGVTLTLQPGATLKFDNGVALWVDGTLDVRGDLSALVSFTSSSVSPVKGDWAGIHLGSTSTASSIDYALIEYASTGVSVDGAVLQISNSTIRNFGSQWTDQGIAFTNGASGLVDANMIDNISRSSERGVYISNSSPHIRGNTISNTDRAIHVDAASPWLEGNILQNNSTGLYLYGASRALVNNQNLIINNNSAGIQFGGDGLENPDSIITNNSIYDNRLNVYINNYENPLDNEVELGGNWWGTTSPSVISSSIFDDKDLWGINASAARVVPFLDGPAGQPVAGNFLNGRIAVDTTLVAGEPYTVVGSYVLPLDTTLSIQPGAVLKFASSAMLHARGQLLIQGQEDNQVVLTASDDIGTLPLWLGVLVGDKDGWFDNNTASSVRGAKFENAFMAIEVAGENMPVSDSEFLNNDYAIELNKNAKSVVSNNRFEGIKTTSFNGQTEGIGISSSQAVSIVKNTVSGLANGIEIEADGRPLVQENILTGNTRGIYIRESNSGDAVKPVINAENTVTGNDYGIDSWRVTAGSVTVNNNNIFGNLINYSKGNYNGEVPVPDDATNNWWNTTVDSEIAAGIDSQTAGTVNYVPFLSGPVPVAPVLDSGTPLTNNSIFPVSGVAQAGIQVRLFVNAVEQLVVNTAPDGSFTGNLNLSEGANAIYAEAFNTTTTSSPSPTLTVTLDSVPPAITLTTPDNGSSINAYPLFTGTLSEASTLSIAGQGVTVASDNSFSHGPVALVEGSNSVQVTATDPAGNVTTLPVNLSLDTTPPPDPDMGQVSFGALSGGSVNVTGAAGAIEAGATVTIANDRSGEVVTLIADTDGSFNASITALDGDSLSLVVADELGNQAAWGREDLPGLAPALAITNTNPADGAVITGDRTTITGTFAGPANTGIVIAGYPASVRDGEFMANNIPLSNGVNTLDITATTPDGNTLTQTLSITGTDAIPFTVTASPDTGIAPLGVTLSIGNTSGAPMALLLVDLDNDGSIDTTFTDLDYNTFDIGPVFYPAGMHQGTVVIVDDAGTSYSLPFAVVVDELVGADARLRAVYNTMLNNLKSGNVAAAVNAISGTSRDQYQSIFDALSSDLPLAITDLGVIQQAVIGDGWAELLVVRGTGGSQTAFKVNLILSEDGVWRIESM